MEELDCGLFAVVKQQAKYLLRQFKSEFEKETMMSFDFGSGSTGRQLVFDATHEWIMLLIGSS